jgi:acyl carrier protein
MSAKATRVAAAELPDIVSAIYRQVLLDDSLDADSDFFEAGGDSLAAFQISARLGEIVGAEIPVALIFAYPTPADLASVVEAVEVGGVDGVGAA